MGFSLILSLSRALLIDLKFVKEISLWTRMFASVLINMKDICQAEQDYRNNSNQTCQLEEEEEKERQITTIVLYTFEFFFSMSLSSV